MVDISRTVQADIAWPAGAQAQGVRRSSMNAGVGRLIVPVHWDNCSHASGKQRAYIKCVCTHHSACFRYRQCDLERDPRRLVAWLLAWAVVGARQGQAWCKADHKAYQPEEEEIGRLLPFVPDDV